MLLLPVGWLSLDVEHKVLCISRLGHMSPQALLCTLSTHNAEHANTHHATSDGNSHGTLYTGNCII